MSARVFAPFTADQVASLNGYQRSGLFHEFTCPLPHPGRALEATPDGWRCPGRDGGGPCDYTQDWAHGWMADWSWQSMLQARNAALDGIS
jgi:hypothetical protein